MKFLLISFSLLIMLSGNMDYNFYNATTNPIKDNISNSETIDDKVSNNSKEIDVLTTYIDDRYPFTFDIPVRWKGHYTLIKRKNGIDFFFKGKPDNEQLIAGITVLSIEKYSEILKQDGFYRHGHFIKQVGKYAYFMDFSITMDLQIKENADMFSKMDFTNDEFIKRLHINDEQEDEVKNLGKSHEELVQEKVKKAHNEIAKRCNINLDAWIQFDIMDIPDVADGKFKGIEKELGRAFVRAYCINGIEEKYHKNGDFEPLFLINNKSQSGLIGFLHSDGTITLIKLKNDDSQDYKFIIEDVIEKCAGE